MLAGVMRVFKAGACAVLFMALSGCVAVALAPIAPLVGGMMGSNHQVVIDDATVDPQLRALLPTVNRLAFMSQEQTTVYAAEHLEMNSDYQVSLVPPPQNVSPSQARRHMETICAGPEQPDVVFYFRSPSSDAGTGTTAMGVLTGRVKFDLDLVTDVLRCDTNWRTQFMTTGKISQGIYNADQTRVDQALGQEFSLALLRLAGKEVPEG